MIGPRDSTNRFWCYQLLLGYIDHLNSNNEEFEISIPSAYYQKKTSYVYVKDIASVIIEILKSGVQNEVFNLGI